MALFELITETGPPKKEGDSDLLSQTQQLNMGNKSSRPRRRAPKINVQPASISDSVAQMGKITPHIPPPVGTTKPDRQIPKIRFRVLIIGRANAGKTSILQRVCDTTDSPLIYRGNEKVRGQSFLSSCQSGLTHPKVQLDPSIDVGDTSASLRPFLILELAWRAQHPG